jgi:hypothetical protein
MVGWRGRDGKGGWKEDGATNGTRTRDIQDHNLALYQLSYGRRKRTLWRAAV